MLPRIVKAVIKSLLYFVFLYLVPMLFVSQMSAFAPEVFVRYEQFLNLYIAIVIFFVVASELTSGTILQHGFNVGKAIIIMIFFVLALDGGVVQLDFEGIHILADLRIYLTILISINLLGLAKSILQAINFLSEKTEIDKVPTQYEAS